MYLSMYVVGVCVCVCVCVYMLICMFACFCLDGTYLHVCMYDADEWVLVHIYIYIYIYIHLKGVYLSFRIYVCIEVWGLMS